jgi:hypothetical protein
MQNCPNPNPRRKSNAEKIKFDQDKPHGDTPAHTPPCLAFIFYAISRRNMLALILAVGFTICHLIYGIKNYIL